MHSSVFCITRPSPQTALRLNSSHTDTLACLGDVLLEWSSLPLPAADAEQKCAGDALSKNMRDLVAPCVTGTRLRRCSCCLRARTGSRRRCGGGVQRCVRVRAFGSRRALRPAFAGQNTELNPQVVRIKSFLCSKYCDAIRQKTSSTAS